MGIGVEARDIDAESGVAVLRLPPVSEVVSTAGGSAGVSVPSSSSSDLPSS